jgi:hypothetical protein
MRSIHSEDPRFYHFRTIQEPTLVELLYERDERVPEPKPVAEVPIGEPVPDVWVHITRLATRILKRSRVGAATPKFVLALQPLAA